MAGHLQRAGHEVCVCSSDRRGQVGVERPELAHASVSVEVDETPRGCASWQIRKDMTIFLDEERRNGAPLPVMALDRSDLQRLTG